MKSRPEIDVACREFLARVPWVVMLLSGALAVPFDNAAAQCIATYHLTVQNDWSQAHHESWAQLFANVDNPHFSHLGGATHNSNLTIWQPGGLSSPGFIQMQEEGWIDNPNSSVVDFKAEFDRHQAAGDAQVFLNYPQHFAAGSSTILSFDISDTHPLVTLFSMLGPTPDWFIGVSGLNLRSGGGWIDTITVDLHTYDGGTRSRDESFALHGPLENPQKLILLIADTPNGLDPDRSALNSSRIGTFTFKLQDVIGCVDTTVTWTGAGGDDSWHTPANWSGGFVPAEANNVIISVGTEPVITHSTGTTTVRSIKCDEAFALSGGMLRLTDGASEFNGPLMLSAGTLHVNGSGAMVNAAGPTTHSGSSVLVSAGARLWLTNQTSMKLTNGTVTLQAQGANAALYLPNVSSVMFSPSNTLFLRAMEGGQIDLQRLEFVSGGALFSSSRTAGSVVNLSSLSVLISRGDSSRLVEIDDGVILLNDTAFLLANVGLELATNKTTILDPMMIARQSLGLYGRSGLAYKIDTRDTQSDSSPWTHLLRVPLTNSFQILGPIPDAGFGFRVTELLADPAQLEIRQVAPQSTQLTLFGLSGMTYRIESTTALVEGGPWEPGPMITLTNSFRVFPASPRTESMLFIKALEVE